MSREPLIGSQKMLQAFVRPHPTEEQDHLLATLDAQNPLRLSHRQISLWDGVVNPKWNDRDVFFFDGKIVDQLGLHFLGMNEDMIGKPILNSQGETVQRGILRVPSRL